MFDPDCVPVEFNQVATRELVLRRDRLSSIVGRLVPVDREFQQLTKNRLTPHGVTLKWANELLRDATFQALQERIAPILEEFRGTILDIIVLAERIIALEGKLD